MIFIDCYSRSHATGTRKLGQITFDNVEGEQHQQERLSLCCDRSTPDCATLLLTLYKGSLNGLPPHHAYNCGTDLLGRFKGLTQKD